MDAFGDFMDYQKELCSVLFGCKPSVYGTRILPGSRASQHDICDNLLRSRLGVPVYLVSFGPTERDKTFKEG
jgi:hypothetical protein